MEYILIRLLSASTDTFNLALFFILFESYFCRLGWHSRWGVRVVVMLGFLLLVATQFFHIVYGDKH